MKDKKKIDLLRSSTTSLTEGFLHTISLLVGMMVTGMVAQKIHASFGHSSIGITLAIVIIGVFLIIAYRPMQKVLATPYAAITILLFIALGTAVGTFILQNAMPMDYVNRYGNTGDKIIHFLQFHDVFHSWWYIGFFIFLGASLIKSSLNKGFHVSNISFHLAHLSPLIILAGFWVDYFWGFRGLIDLEVGSTNDQVKLYNHSKTAKQTFHSLDFQLQLDSFKSAKYEPEYRIQLWENDADEMTQVMPDGNQKQIKIPKILASFGLEKGKIRSIYNADIHFRMNDFYPNFEFQYTYPENTDTIDPVAPGIMLDLKTDLVETSLQLRSDKPDQNKIADPSLGTSLEFYWEPTEEELKPLKQPEGMSEEALRAHSPMGGIGKIVFSGKEKMIYFIKGDKKETLPMETDRFYPFFDEGSQGFTFKFLFPDSKYLKASPGSRNDELTNPVAEVEVWGKYINPSQEAFLYPGMQQRGGTFSVPGTKYFLALESIKERETKFWKSNISILENEEVVVKSKEILVNEPLYYNGHRFYQSNYDPQNPNYSGIGVSYNPGLNLIYFGFMLMVAGIIWMFYFKYANRMNGDSLTANNN